MKISITLVIALIALVFLGFKLLSANKVKGKRAEIRPFRQKSNLLPLGVITVTLGEIKREGDDVWFICPLDEEKKLGNFVFNYVKIKPKSYDDNFNKKKAVIAYVLGGHNMSIEEPKFIDWGLVKVV
jgi:hypothetical protein